MTSAAVQPPISKKERFAKTTTPRLVITRASNAVSTRSRSADSPSSGGATFESLALVIDARPLRRAGGRAAGDAARQLYRRRRSGATANGDGPAGARGGVRPARKR